ncbi:hypothetical protein [Nannocystis bainbridge]|uniref:VWFA domain-containing protein n=1 Tax=Nannocystis bainbridge TaxID=2995303 RepID=A0ABT5DW01_9BACT|nr:hypothetical protein [Nannocystis bainbridge]MDC0716898.1 hypothetical protein [Nannocystis bainbridge]
MRTVCSSHAGRVCVLAALTLTVAACGDDASTTGATGTPTTAPTTLPPLTTTDDSAGTTDPGTGSGTDTGASATSTGNLPTTTGGSDTGGIKLDLGQPDFPNDPTGDTDAAKGCTAVDLLFVIDNSASMGQHQEDLSAVFPDFVDAIIDALPPGTDLHVGLTTTSFYDGGCSESTVNCVSQSSEQEILQHYVAPPASTNENGGQGRLFEWQGQHYFSLDTDEDPSALKSWFTAAATAAGETGCSFEMPAAAAGWAADPATAPTNDGFIRDAGAVLVVFVLTDEPDKSPEPVSQWVDKLVAAKQACGGLDCILASGLVPGFCYDNPGDSTLKTFLQSFSAPPFTGDIDGNPSDYAMVVGDALAGVIQEKCEEIEPPA